MKEAITIGHSKGGVGKSTVSFNLAHALKKTTDEKVTIIDLDFQQTLFFISQLNPNGGIEVLQPQSASELIELLEELHGYIIIDLGGFDSDINRIAIKYSDKLIVPIAMSITDVLGFQTFKAILDEINTKASINILLNNIHPLTKDLEEIRGFVKGQLQDFKVLDTVIRTRAIYKTSLAVGKSVLDFADTKAIAEIIGLKDELI